MKGKNVPVTQEAVISFCRSLLLKKVPAWQRLQGVRAIEAYRDLVLRKDSPSLAQIKQRLCDSLVLNVRWAVRTFR